jgi:hypothetical protein
MHMIAQGLNEDLKLFDSDALLIVSTLENVRHVNASSGQARL